MTIRRREKPINKIGWGSVMDFKIDWLTLTLKPEKDSVTYNELKGFDVGYDVELCPLEKWLFDFLKLHKIRSDFKFKCGSVQHYNYMYSYNGIDIAFSNSEHFASQGLMIRFSAHGIAFYEQYRKAYEKEWNWVNFLKEFFSLSVYNLKCRCTRIDLAYDDISYDDNKLLSLERINKAVSNGEVVTLFRRVPDWDKNEQINEITRIRERTPKGKLIGETIEFGNRKSAVFLRFYDKLKEQLKLKREVDEKIKHWVRMEFEFKQNRAMAVCDSLILLSSEEFGKYFSQVVNRYIRFVKPEGDSKHLYRCKLRKWWRDIVGTVEKACLVENKATKNAYKSAKRWLQRTVYPTLYSILNCDTIDNFLTDLQQAGIDGYSYRHDMIIKDYLSEKADEVRKGIEHHKTSTDSFEVLVAELETVARSNQMKKSGAELCEILDLWKEFENFHGAKISGMYEKHIDEFENRQMVLYNEMCAINKTFYDLGVVV